MKRTTLILSSLAIGILAPTWSNAEQSLRNQLNIESSAPERTGPLAGYAEVVEEIAPSVVSIIVSKKPNAAPVAAPEMFNDPFFREFFGDRFNPREMQPRQPREMPKQQGMGSGVILTADGYIATNNHVVAGADTIEVTLPGNRKTYEAEIIGADKATDVALIKIAAKDLSAATLGDNQQVKVGDTVLAIGNPFGLNQTVTTGIVSALGRNNLSITDYGNFIQTDASINPGNSGGALIDNKGRVIGINTAIFSRSGGNQGIGFAIPINLAVDIMDRLMSDGEVQRGYLGVMLTDLSPDLARGFGVEPKGALVNEVMADTPAADAGVKAGDIIVNYDGKRVENMAGLRMRVANTRPNSKVNFDIIRDGRDKTLSVKIGLLPGSDTLANAKPANNNSESPSDEILPGAAIANLTESARAAYSVPNEVVGVAVVNVDPNSAAAEAGLRVGDVITSVARREVDSVADAVAARREFKGDVLLLRITNQQGSRFIAVELS